MQGPWPSPGSKIQPQSVYFEEAMEPDFTRATKQEKKRMLNAGKRNGYMQFESIGGTIPRRVPQAQLAAMANSTRPSFRKAEKREQLRAKLADKHFKAGDTHKLKQLLAGRKADEKFYASKHAIGGHKILAATAGGQQVPRVARPSSAPRATVPRMQAPGAGRIGTGQQRHIDKWKDYADTYKRIVGSDPFDDARRAGKAVAKYLTDWWNGAPAAPHAGVHEHPTYHRKHGNANKGSHWMTAHEKPIASAARQVMMAAPAAMSMAAPHTGFSTMTGTRSSKDGITIVGCDYLHILTADTAAGQGTAQAAGSYLLNLDLNPSVLGINRIRQLATIFEMFEFEYFIIHYAPGCGSDAGGSMVLYTETDPDDVLPTDGQARLRTAFGHAGVATSSYWAPAKFHITCKKGKFYIDAGDEERLTTQGHINCLVNIPDPTGLSAGVFFAEYKLALSRSREDANVGSGGNWWLVEQNSPSAVTQVWPYNVDFKAGSNQTTTIASGSMLNVTAIPGTEPLAGNNATLITVESTVPCLVSSYTEGASTTNVPDFLITNQLPTYFDNSSGLQGATGWTGGEGFNVGGTQTANFFGYTATRNAGPGVQSVVTSTILPNQENFAFQSWVLWPAAGSAQVGSVVQFWVCWKNYSSNGTTLTISSGSAAAPNLKGGRTDWLLIQPIQLNSSLNNVRQLRIKASRLFAKMKALQGEVEIMQTKIQADEDAKERKDEEDRKEREDQKGDKKLSLGAGYQVMDYPITDDKWKPRVLTPEEITANFAAAYADEGGEEKDEESLTTPDWQKDMIKAEIAKATRAVDVATGGGDDDDEDEHQWDEELDGQWKEWLKEWQIVTKSPGKVPKHGFSMRVKEWLKAKRLKKIEEESKKAEARGAALQAVVAKHSNKGN